MHRGAGGERRARCEVSNGKKISSKLQRRWRWRQELGWRGQTEDAEIKKKRWEDESRGS